MNTQQRMKLIREMAIQADLLYSDAERLGQRARGLKAAQVKGLERIAESALKVSDILDYVKTRTGRHQEEWKEVGPELVAYIAERLAASRDELCRLLGIAAGGADAQQVHLNLIRAFVRQVVAQYEYVAAQREYAAAGGRPA